MKIALAGNPNSGKTTLYNAITGANEKVGNWAGVTVDKKERPIRRNLWQGEGRPVVVDLPGAYSMSPYTGEESITSSYVKEENPDVIINIVDATGISRSLFFTTQLLELGIPVVVALNKSDLNRKRENKIDTEELSRALCCPVFLTTSTTGEGLKELVQAAANVVGTVQKAPFSAVYTPASERKIVEQEDRRRFAFVKELSERVLVRGEKSIGMSVTDRVDILLTNKWLGIPVFALVMFLVFQISQVWLGAWIADGFVFTFGGTETFVPGLVPLIERLGDWVAALLSEASPFLSAIVVDGIIGGVGAVVGFLPLVMVMYFLIALLEDCGYMSRVAVVLDPIFKKVGLTGRSVIPFVIAVGCAVPGVMASRTIKSDRERRATAMLAPFMPCGAKIPVIALFAGAFFDGAGWISTLVYLLGIVIIFVSALLVNRMTGYRARKSYFIIELAEYKMPSVWTAFRSMLSRGWSYIVKASTIILLCNMGVQLMQSFNWNFALAESAETSILATLARPFSYVLLPLVGVASWQLAAAALTGFIAKENVVGTLAVCFVGLENLIDTENLALMEGAGGEVAGVLAITKVAALAYLMFNLYSPPCFAAIGAMNAEMKSAKWLWGGIGLQFGVGFTVSYLFYTVGTLCTAPALLNVPAAVVGALSILLLVLYIVWHIRKTDRALALDAVS